MSSLNKCMFIGNVGRDPEMRYTPNGDAVTTFSVAVNDRWTAKDGEKHESVEWVNVVAWRKLAETCAAYLAKGRQVYVEGRLKTRSWDGQDGIKHYRTELQADKVLFLGPRDELADALAGDGGYVEPDDLPF